MAVNAANARIFGSDNDAVWIADVGTALPDDLTEPAGFSDVGWLHSDGITVGGDTNVERFTGHQGGKTVRTKVTESSTTFQFQCLETTALTLGLQFNIKDKEGTADLIKATVSSGRRVAVRSFVVDVYDEDAETLQYRFAIPRGEIGERSEFTLSNSDITGYTFTVEVIGDYYILTNDQAFADPAPEGAETFAAPMTLSAPAAEGAAPVTVPAQEEVSA